MHCRAHIMEFSKRTAEHPLYYHNMMCIYQHVRMRKAKPLPARQCACARAGIRLLRMRNRAHS